jgi:hypothetical protein
MCERQFVVTPAVGQRARGEAVGGLERGGGGRGGGEGGGARARAKGLS